MTVRALLKGHEFDLQILVDMFPEGDPCVVKDGDDRFHLESGELDPHMDEAGRLIEVAERVLADLTGSARLTHGDFQRVEIAGSFERFEGSIKTIHVTDSAVGRERVVVARPEPATARVSVRVVGAATHPEGEVVPALEPTGRRHLRLARAYPEVAELLGLVGKSEMDWDDLYNAFEIVREASKAGRKPRFSLEQLGYDKTEVDSFSATVNLHRHARPTGRPKRELTLAEAQAFTRDMAERWFTMLEADSSSSCR